MPCDKIKVVSLVIENMVYVTMVGLGIFLIFHGDVVHKFQLRRTNFAIYEEDIFELPNIVTYIWPMKNFTLGKDFSIFFRSGFDHSTKWKMLKRGENKIVGRNFTMHLENLFEGLSAAEPQPNSFRIKANNFSAGMPVDFRLKYTFQNSSIMTGSEIIFSLRPENGCLSCNGNYHEGEIQRTTVSLGKVTKLTLAGEKWYYLPEHRKCRKRPYNDILIETILKQVKSNCVRPCKPVKRSQKATDSFDFCHALRSDKEIDKWPFCEDKNDTRCFFDSFDVTQEKLKGYSGPCTELRYFAKSKHDKYLAANKNTALVQVSFDIPRLGVGEEYLIYDFIAMISAIGGTLGLCIGFSFTNVTSSTLKHLERVINAMWKNKMMSETAHQSTCKKSNWWGSKTTQEEPIMPFSENHLQVIAKLHIELAEHRMKISKLEFESMNYAKSFLELKSKNLTVTDL